MQACTLPTPRVTILPQARLVVECLHTLRGTWGLLRLLVPATLRRLARLFRLYWRLKEGLVKIEAMVEVCTVCDSFAACEIMEGLQSSANEYLSITDEIVYGLKDVRVLQRIYWPYYQLAVQWQHLSEDIYIYRNPALRLRVREALEGVENEEDVADIIAVILAEDEMERGESIAIPLEGFTRTLRAQ